MSKPVAVGPQSRTVIGDNSTSPSVKSIVAPPPKKHSWKRLMIPAGIAGAVFLALRYKGHV